MGNSENRRLRAQLAAETLRADRATADYIKIMDDREELRGALSETEFERDQAMGEAAVLLDNVRAWSDAHDAGYGECLEQTTISLLTGNRIPLATAMLARLAGMKEALKSLKLAAQPASNILFNLAQPSVQLDDHNRTIIREALVSLDAALNVAAAKDFG